MYLHAGNNKNIRDVFIIELCASLKFCFLYIKTINRKVNGYTKLDKLTCNILLNNPINNLNIYKQLNL